jgi:hypothetical protein
MIIKTVDIPNGISWNVVEVSLTALVTLVTGTLHQDPNACLCRYWLRGESLTSLGHCQYCYDSPSQRSDSGELRCVLLMFEVLRAKVALSQVLFKLYKKSLLFNSKWTVYSNLVYMIENFIIYSTNVFSSVIVDKQERHSRNTRRITLLIYTALTLICSFPNLCSFVLEFKAKWHRP